MSTSDNLLRQREGERARERRGKTLQWMRSIYSHSPASTANGFQLQMTHRAFVHAMLTRTLIKWVGISSKRWLWKGGRKTFIWIVCLWLLSESCFTFLLRNCGTACRYCYSYSSILNIWVWISYSTCSQLTNGLVDMVPLCMLSCCCNLDREHQCSASLMLVWNHAWPANIIIYSEYNYEYIFIKK